MGGIVTDVFSTIIVAPTELKSLTHVRLQMNALGNYLGSKIRKEKANFHRNESFGRISIKTNKSHRGDLLVEHNQRIPKSRKECPFGKNIIKECQVPLGTTLGRKKLIINCMNNINIDLCYKILFKNYG